MKGWRLAAFPPLDRIHSIAAHRANLETHLQLMDITIFFGACCEPNETLVPWGLIFLHKPKEIKLFATGSLSY